MRTKVPRACILAIGTELTSGEVLNRNSTWISSRLQALGIEIVLHETVPDSHDLILSGLRRCEELGNVLFVTGGLGPTSDDFTRNVIARWCESPLEYHEATWTRIRQRLEKLGVAVAESNRQQCFFPRGARVLLNSRGTAEGFQLEKGGTLAWILPGPPDEIEAIWQAAPPEKELLSRFTDFPKLRLLRWRCLGKSEAALGELTEAVLAGSGLRIGYRAHRPYVEIKVWCPEAELTRHEPLFARLSESLKPWCVARGDEDPAAIFLRALERGQEIELLDVGSGGLLTERLAPLLRKSEYRWQAENLVLANEWSAYPSPEEWLSAVLSQADPQAITLALAGPDQNGSYRIGLRDGGSVHQQALEPPGTGARASSAGPGERDRRYAVEMAFQVWTEWLKRSVS
ncbi:MAG: molybdopterin-binding protein [Oligoflexia bacterium]|nr:molybdopterin-binding protein [Oligoflexia bacterium]